MSEQSPGVVLVNPNTNRATTAMMGRRLQTALADMDCNLQVTTLTVTAGPAMITGPGALADAAGHVVDLVQGLARVPEDAPRVVVAAFGDPGVPELQDAGFRVTGIGEAAVRAAAEGGRRFAVATTTPDLADSIAGLVPRALRKGSAADLFTGVELTTTEPLVLAEDPVACREELDAVVRRCLVAGAQRVVIGGGPLGDAAAGLAGRYPDVIVEPLTAAAAELSAAAATPRHS